MRIFQFLILLTGTLLLGCETNNPLPDPPAGQFVFGGEWNDFGHSIVETDDGGFLLAGGTQSFSSDGRYDIWLMKADRNGNELWQRTYGSEGTDDIAFRIIRIQGGGYAIAGFTAAQQNGRADIYIIKLDDGFNVTFESTFALSSYNYNVLEIAGLYETPDQGLLIATRAFDDPHLIKIGSNGLIEWERTYFDATAPIGGNFITPSANGGFFMLAQDDAAWQNNSDYYLYRLDDYGNDLWAVTGSWGNVYPNIHGLIESPDSALIAAYFDNSSYNFRIAKLDTTGNQQWSVSRTSDFAYNILLNRPAGGFLLCGDRDGRFGYSANTSIRVEAVDANGESPDVTGYDGDRNEKVSQAILTSDGRFAIIGQTTSYGVGGVDMFLTFYED